MPHLAGDPHGLASRGSSVWFLQGHGSQRVGLGPAVAASLGLFKMQILRPTPRPESGPLEVEPAVPVVTSPPGDAEAHSGLGTSLKGYLLSASIRNLQAEYKCPCSALHHRWSLSLEVSSNLTLLTLTSNPLWSLPCNLREATAIISSPHA